MAVNFRSAAAAGLPTYLIGLTLPVVAGLVFMWGNNAPLSYLGLNAGALVAGLMLASYPPSRLPDFTWPMLGVLIVAILALPLLLGPELDGISRWIAIGPLRMHAAMLLVPALLVIAARLPEPRASALIGAAAIVIALQPDRASAFALLIASIASFMLTKSRAMLIASAAALAGLMTALQLPDELEGVRFVEQVLHFAWIVQPWAAMMMGIALIGAIVALLIANRDTRVETLCGPVGVAAFLSGLAVASLLGNYPTPLIGFGASSILGYGFAVFMLRRSMGNI